MTSPNPSTPSTPNTTPTTTPDLTTIDPHDVLIRRNPADFDIQEGQERIQSDPNPDPATPPGKLDDKPINSPRI